MFTDIEYILLKQRYNQIESQGQHHGGMSSLILSLLLTPKIQHSFMNKNASEGVVGPSTICQGSQKEYCPSMHQGRGQILVQAVEPAGACELASALSAVFTKHLESTDLSRHPQTRQAFQLSKYPEERFKYSVGEKNASLNALERVKEILPVCPSPMVAQCGTELACGDLSCGGKVVSECSTSPTVHDAVAEKFLYHSTQSTEARPP